MTVRKSAFNVNAIAPQPGVLPGHLRLPVERAEVLADARGLYQWMASGACQSESGAFCAWLDVYRNTLAFEYPEITGYALTLLANLEPLEGRPLAVGRMAADWLIQRLESGNWSARDGWDSGAVYNFDLAMIATGLLRFGNVAGRRRYVKWGFALVNDLRQEIDLEGRLRSVSKRGGVSSMRAGVWSTDGSAHLLKVTQCLLLADSMGLHGAADAAAAIVEHSKRYQHYDGRFETQSRDSVTMLHPHLYAGEGLWMYGTARGDAESLARARAAASWAWRHQLENGAFPRSVTVHDGYHAGNQFEQLDVTAQAVRLAVLLELDEPRLPEAVARLREAAQPVDEFRAMPYQPSAPDLHYNAWSSMFAAQALQLASGEAPALRWHDLV